MIEVLTEDFGPGEGYPEESWEDDVQGAMQVQCPTDRSAGQTGDKHGRNEDTESMVKETLQ